MKLGRGSFVVASLLAATSLVAAPLIQPTSQDRSISGSAYAEDPFTGPVSDSDGDQAADFGLFDSARSADALVDTASSSGGGSQTSEITDDTISATGSMFANAEVWDFDTFADASSTNRMRVTFQLTGAVDYTIQGQLTAVDQGITEIHLTDSSSVIYSELIFGNATLLPIDTSGSLPAGQYTLEVLTQGSAFGQGFDSEYSSGSYDITFHVMGAGAGGPGGEVPDGDDVLSGNPLTVTRLPNDVVRLDWSASCRPGDGDYIVYEGEIGFPNSLAPVTCTTAGLLSYDLAPLHTGSFFIVVPTDGVGEGSYGDDSDGLERSASASACLPQSLGAPVCP